MQEDMLFLFGTLAVCNDTAPLQTLGGMAGIFIFQSKVSHILQGLTTIFQQAVPLWLSDQML